MQLPCGILDGLSLDVLCQDIARPALSDDSSLLGPEVDGGAASAARAREGLARERSVEDVNDAAPGATVELADIGEDGKPRERAFDDSLQEHALAVGANLDSSDGAMPEQHVREQPAASSRKKVERSEGVQLMALLTLRLVHRVPPGPEQGLRRSSLDARASASCCLSVRAPA